MEIPVDVGAGVRTLDKVSMWEQLSLAALAQKYWADNQVSCTVAFNPETEGEQIGNALDIFQYQLKGISFLPRLGKGAYRQMPYETIEAKQYKKMVSKINKLPVPNFSAGGIATPADASLVMQLGAESVFVGSGIFKSEDPIRRAKAIVDSVTYFQDPNKLAKVSDGLKSAMKGLDISEIHADQMMQERGW